MNKINYPKNRKPRLLTNTMTYKLLNSFNWDEVVDFYIKWGRYKTAEKYNVSCYIVRYVMERHNIKRPLPKHLQIGYLRGNWPPIGKKMKANYV